MLEVMAVPIKSVRIRLMEAVTVVLDWEHW